MPEGEISLEQFRQLSDKLERNSFDWPSFVAKVKGKIYSFADLTKLFQQAGGGHSSNLRRKVDLLVVRGQAEKRYKLEGAKVTAVVRIFDNAVG